MLIGSCIQGERTHNWNNVWQWLTFTHILHGNSSSFPPNSSIFYNSRVLCSVTKALFPHFQNMSLSILLSSVWLQILSGQQHLSFQQCKFLSQLYHLSWLCYFDPILPRMGVSTWYNCSSNLFSPGLFCQRHRQQKETLDSSLCCSQYKSNM